MGSSLPFQGLVAKVFKLSSNGHGDQIGVQFSATDP